MIAGLGLGFIYSQIMYKVSFWMTWGISESFPSFDFLSRKAIICVQEAIKCLTRPKIETIQTQKLKKIYIRSDTKVTLNFM